MNTQAKIVVGLLVASVAGLAIALGVVLASDDDGGGTPPN